MTSQLPVDSYAINQPVRSFRSGFEKSRDYLNQSAIPQIFTKRFTHSSNHVNFEKEKSIEIFSAGFGKKVEIVENHRKSLRSSNTIVKITSNISGITIFILIRPTDISTITARRLPNFRVMIPMLDFERKFQRRISGEFKPAIPRMFMKIFQKIFDLDFDARYNSEA